MEHLTIFALALFVITYVLMFSFQKIRPYVAVVSAVLLLQWGAFPFFRYSTTLGGMLWVRLTGTSS